MIARLLISVCLLLPGTHPPVMAVPAPDTVSTAVGMLPVPGTHPPVAARPAPDTLPSPPDTLPPAAVSARRQISPPTESATGEKLQRALNVSDAIRDFSGIQLRDYGGAGGLKTINVRSLGSAHTAIFLDGVPIDNAQNMQVDLGRLATSSLERIDLYQGQRSELLQSAREYGSASSLHLKSAMPSRKRLVKLHLHGGAFGTVAPEASWEQGWGARLRSRIQVAASLSHGRYPFRIKDFRNTPDGYVGYDTLMTRENGDLKAFRTLAQLFYLPEGGQYQLSVNWYDSERGIPGPVYKQADKYPLSTDRQEDRDLSVQASGEQRLGEKVQLLLSGKYARDFLSYLDVSELDPTVMATWKYLQQSAYLSGALDWEAASWLHVSGAVDGLLETLEAQVPARRRTLFAALAGSLFKGPWRASLSLQYQLSSGAGNYSFLSPALLLNWHPAPEWEFGGLVKRSCRLPSFNDLYYTNVTVRGLEPESVWQAAARWSWKKQIGPWQFNAREELYYNWVENKLVAVPNGSLFRWSMYNIGGVHIFGDEISARAAYDTGRWMAGATARYSYQLARDTETGGQIPYIPLHSASLNLVGVWNGFSLEVQGFLSGERFTSSTNRADFRIAPWSTWDILLGWERNSLKLGVQLKNILDEQYQIIKQYPMPGFHVLASLDYSF